MKEEQDQPARRYLADGTIVEWTRNPNPDQPVTMTDVQDRRLENVAKGYWMGHSAHNRNRVLKQQLEKKVTNRIGVKGKLLTDKLFELIEGVYIVTEEKINQNTGKPIAIKYYREKPDLKAIVYALNRVLGKPTERKETFNENEGLKTIESIIKTLADNSRKRVDEKIIEAGPETVEAVP